MATKALLSMTILLLLSNVARAWIEETCTPSLHQFIGQAPVEAVAEYYKETYPTSALTGNTCAGTKRPTTLGVTIFVTSPQGINDTYNDLASYNVQYSNETAWYALFQSSTRLEISSGSPACKTVTVPGTDVANALQLFSELPQGAFSAEKLVELGSLKTALAYLREGSDPNAQEYKLAFTEKATNGSVCINSTAVSTCIVKSVLACNGYIHILDRQLLPSTFLNTSNSESAGAEARREASGLIVPLTGSRQTLYDIPTKQLEPEIQNSTDEPAAATNASDSDSRGLIAGVLIGLVIGGLAFIAIGVMLWFWYKRKTRLSQSMVFQHYSARIDPGMAAYSGIVPVSSLYEEQQGWLPGQLMEWLPVLSANDTREATPKNLKAFNSARPPEYYISLKRHPTTRQYMELGRGAYGIVYHGALLDRASFKKILDTSSSIQDDPATATNEQPLPSSRRRSVSEDTCIAKIFSNEQANALIALSTPVALKTLNYKGDAAEDAFAREARILSEVNTLNTNVVYFYGSAIDSYNRLMLVTELMEGGDLREALTESDTNPLQWYRYGKSVALDITAALVTLHEHRIIHRDLKSKNILLTKSFQARVGDVGVSAFLYKTYLSGEMVGTLAWAAPELVMGKPCTEKVDIYSLGVVLWEIATGSVPVRGFMPELNSDSDRYPHGLREIITMCTAEDPKERPTAQEVYERICQLPPTV